MIYCVAPELYPKEEHRLEELVYKDQNNFEWRIARIKSGLMIKPKENPLHLGL